jgi:hypothetical protein
VLRVTGRAGSREREESHATGRGVALRSRGVARNEEPVCGTRHRCEVRDCTTRYVLRSETPRVAGLPLSALSEEGTGVPSLGSWR